ncbi:MAG: hypothetical protein WCD81_09655 [Candidatus Bathyarchaeia archaeon]
MGKLNINVQKDVDEKFRTEVFRRKGLKKGNIKEAVEEAMILWISTTQKPIKKEDRKP